MARYLIAQNGVIVKELEAKNIKQALMQMKTLGTFDVYTLQAEPRTATLREVVQMAIDVGGEEE